MKKRYSFTFLILSFLLQGTVPLKAQSGLSGVPFFFEETEATFQAFIKTLREAAEQKNPYPIYRAVSPLYIIERDFGGIFDPTANAIVNFSASFPFDNEMLFPEYKNYGWNAFQEKLMHLEFERKDTGEMCVPAGATEVRPYPLGQLCFAKGARREWKITRYIKGGD